MLQVPMTKYDDPADCPFRDVIDHIGSKWGFMILASLEDKPHRFNEIKRMIGDISQRMLTKSLRDLERDGLVVRTVFAESPPKVIYELSELGRDLLTPIKIFVEWAANAHQEIKESRKRYDSRQSSVIK